MSQSRDDILQNLWKAQDDAYDLMYEYDMMPHHYGKDMLYQAEGTIINLIGSHPGITITDLGEMLRKTPSACSQIVRKLREKGLVEQTRNKQNNRQYNLQLTEKGFEVYEAHIQFNLECQKETFEILSVFSEEELAIHVAVQRKINEAYRQDVLRGKQRESEFIDQN